MNIKKELSSLNLPAITTNKTDKVFELPDQQNSDIERHELSSDVIVVAQLFKAGYLTIEEINNIDWIPGLHFIFPNVVECKVDLEVCYSCNKSFEFTKAKEPSAQYYIFNKKPYCDPCGDKIWYKMKPVKCVQIENGKFINAEIVPPPLHKWSIAKGFPRKVPRLSKFGEL